jgi:hypothetical protein
MEWFVTSANPWMMSNWNAAFVQLFSLESRIKRIHEAGGPSGRVN